MRLTKKIVLLTLVAAWYSWSAPTTEMTLEEQQKAYDEPLENKKDVNLEQENLILSPKLQSKKVKRKKKSKLVPRNEYYHIYQSAVNFRVATSFNLKVGNLPSEPLGGFSYQFPYRYSPHWETGIDFTKNSNSYIWAAKKWTINEKGSYRPFYKFGALHSWKSSQKMVSFTNFQNYLLYGSVGFEDILSPPQSVRFELELGLGTNEMVAIVSVGTSWGFL